MSKVEGMSPADTYRIIKQGLMSGQYAAGAKLRPDDFKDEFGISASAMREVFLRLAHEYLLAQEEQRGFHVPPASDETLGELMRLRILLECEGARLSIKNGDLEWEAHLTAAHHKLAHVESKMRVNPDDAELVALWTRVDWEFHQALLSACGSESLRQVHRNIYERFRQQVILAIETAGFRAATISEHDAIRTAAVNRDVQACATALEEHLQTYREDMRNQKKLA